MTTGINNETVRKQAAIVFLLALAAITLYLCYLIAKPFLAPLVIAVMLAIVFHPLHLKIRTLFGNPSAGAAISTALVLFAVAIPIVILGFSVSGELSAVLQSMRERSGSQGVLNPYLEHLSRSVLSWFGNYVNLSALDPEETVLRGAEQVSRYLLSVGAAAVSNALSFLLDLVVVFFSLFFFFREGESILQGLGALLPLSEEQTKKLFAEIGKTTTANLYGGLAVAAAQGSLTGLAFGVLGLSAPVLWALVTAMASLVPVFGSSLVWGPAALLLFVSGHWIKAVILLAWGAGVVGQIDALVRPYIVGAHVKVHTLLVFFSLLGGVEAFGIVGIFIGPVVLSVTMAVLDMIRKTDFSWKSSPQSG
ncbi:MAG TPA: AI-2E family transporter [Candidatus Dormibacteraeota bacterium]|nr:AI-2E family transporter [Candidatus Dormibacteraeota bacterium]